MKPILLQMSVGPQKAHARPDMSRVRTIVTKVTSRCNIRCSYCYEHLQLSGDMKLDTFKTLAQSSISGSSRLPLTFLFHGGEPTLIGEAWFDAAIEYARQLGHERGRVVKFAVQSNGIAISDSMIDLFVRHRVRVSMSLDGPSTARPMRPKVADALRTLRRARAAGLRPGVLMTINQSNWDDFDAIYCWLRDELAVRTFKANIVASVGSGRELAHLSREQVLRSHSTLLECMMQHADRGPFEINLARELLRFFDYSSTLNHSNSLCSGQTCGAGGSVIGVSPDGRVLPCGRFGWDDDEFSLGHLVDFTDGGDEPRAFREAVKRFHSIAPDNWRACHSCAASKICSYGCQAFTARSEGQRNIECAPTQGRYEYFRHNEERLRPLAEALASHFSDASDAGGRAEGDYGDDGYSDSGYSDYHDDGYCGETPQSVAHA
jgi:uncharacterized protein